MLAILLGLGFLALEARAQSRSAAAAAGRPAIAFLGMAEGSDPQLGETIVKRIRRELGVDSTLVSIPGEEVDKLFARGILRGPDASPTDAEALRREIGDAYLAYGILERIAVTSQRKWWKPWTVKSTWTQGLRLHVTEGARGPVIFDGLVASAKPESGFLTGPEGDWGKLPPLEREKRMRSMAEMLSVETAKALAKAVKDRAAPAAASSDSATPG